jgi:hypothetical protein
MLLGQKSETAGFNVGLRVPSLLTAQYGPGDGILRFSQLGKKNEKILVRDSKTA